MSTNNRKAVGFQRKQCSVERSRVTPLSSEITCKRFHSSGGKSGLGCVQAWARVQLIRSGVQIPLKPQPQRREKKEDYFKSVRHHGTGGPLSRNAQGLHFKNMSTKKLNNGQQKAFDGIMEFLDSDLSYACISGYAGTGKTFLLSELVENLVSQKKRRRISITAPTHKAVGVIKAYFAQNKKVNSKITFSTVQKLLGLKPEINQVSGKQEFKPDGFSEVSFYDVVVVDETSMLDDELFFAIDDSVGLRKESKNPLKVIFIGDPKQIPPVNKEDSEPFLNPEMYNIQVFNLEEIMRQKTGSPIIDASVYVREKIGSLNCYNLEKFQSEGHFEIVRNGLQPNRVKLHTELKSLFSSDEFKKDPSMIRVIAWRNVTVNKFNLIIRKFYHGKDELPEYVAGDLLIANQPYSADGVDFLFVNSDEIIVKKCKQENISVMGDNYDVWTITGEINNPDSDKIEVVEFPLVSETSREKYQVRLNNLRNVAFSKKGEERRSAWKRFYEFKDSFADCNYGFALTAHKSQGSTYDTVYVDLNDIILNERVVERNRIIYTSITRAKNKVTLILK